MSAKSDKTNAMRQLDQKKLPYCVYAYGGGALSGVEVAAALNEDAARVFKTLVTVAKSGRNYVFMVPAAEELDLKKAAKAVGEKAVSMIKSKELLPLTGYVHGGCSPIGMKKQFTTVAHQSAREFDVIYFSGGRIGCQISMSPEDLLKAVPISYADIIVSKQDGQGV